ncbi:MAG: hypothetical protein U0176_10700 [Bacteroidia bacterium]
MHTVEVLVNRQVNGYNFVLLPSIRELIKRLVPNAQPANNIFVGYDLKTPFDQNLSKVEAYIYPALLGVENREDLKSIGTINFIDTQTQSLLHSIQL